MDLRRDVLLVNGKGDKQRAIPFGEKTGQALSPRETNTRYVSLFPKWVGQTQPRLDGETLRLSTATPIRSGGVLVHSHLDTSLQGSARSLTATRGTSDAVRLVCRLGMDCKSTSM